MNGYPDNERDRETKHDLERVPRESTLANLSYIRKEMTETMQEVSKIADRGASTLLLSLGATTLLIAFALKIRPFGVQFADLSAVEFIAAVTISMVLLLAGSGIRLYQFNKQEEAGGKIRESGVDLLNKSIDVGASLARHGSPSGRAASNL